MNVDTYDPIIHNTVKIPSNHKYHAVRWHSTLMLFMIIETKARNGRQEDTDDDKSKYSDFI